MQTRTTQTRPSGSWIPKIVEGFGLLGLLLVLAGSPASAKKHPVPLDPKTDSATCLQCHDSVGKGKAVHTAMGAGCTTCHEVRVNREVTRVKLTATTSVALCLTCHSDKDTASVKGISHNRSVRNCLQCHNPHSSENENQLLKVTEGDAKSNLCLSCHGTGLNTPEKGSHHAAVDMGCSTCHTIHKTGDPGKLEFDAHLTKASPAICLDCHDAGDENLKKAHQQQPFASADCLTCHDPHSSSSPKLLQKFVHSPFAEKACEACHQPAEKEKVVLTQTEARAVCAVCHEETAKQIETAKVTHPGAAGDCTQCHDPHAGRTPGFVKPNPVAACVNCHDNQKQMQETKKVLHQAAFKDGCATCHEPHGGDKPKLLRAEGNALCLACHSSETRPQKAESSGLIAVFDGKVRLPANYFRNVTKLGLKMGMGHPTANHPVNDYADPLDPKKITKISCLTCHQPHAGAARAMLVTDTRPNVQFCRRCHEGMIGVRP